MCSHSKKKKSVAKGLTLEQRRVVASLMEVYGSPTVVRQKFAERFAGRDPPSRLKFYRVYTKI
jgi:hypothetical protein